MTEKDQRLVSKATRLHYYDDGFWETMESCESQAESEEAKRAIHLHKISEYHKEEYRAGMN